MSEIQRMKELVKLLSDASNAYYNEDQEIMSNYEYDQLYDELQALETKLGTTLSDSPTYNVGYEVQSDLPKERHQTRMLSLDKTKDRDALVQWIGTEEGLLSWKLDGLTIVLTYEKGQLVKAVTRGNGDVGEVITNNVKVFKNVPLKISSMDSLVVRGEAVIKYSDFLKINDEIEGDELYKNPRNLCSGTVRQLNNEVTAQRRVHFYAFQLISLDGYEEDSKHQQLQHLTTLGFDVVEVMKVTKDNMLQAIETFEQQIPTNDIGSDGLVLTYDSNIYSMALGVTSKFPRHSIAFKWKDEIKETILTGVEWSASRTGLINPVALFEPVELEGTTVARASLHNISILQELELGIGDRIEVYKANMIIPQVASNLSRSHNLEIPLNCPVCNGQTQIKEVKDVKVLYCINPDCAAKKNKSFAHYVSRDAMNIDGLSEATIEKLIAKGYIHELPDLYNLADYGEDIVLMDGFGQKSYDKLIQAIETSKHCRIENFIYALGIQNVGLSNAKLLCKHYNYDIDAIRNAQSEELESIEGFGEIIANSLYTYLNDPKVSAMIDRLLEMIAFEVVEQNKDNQVLEGLTFVITGSLEHYENRNALKEEIEARGGKVTGSVTSKTHYLINNNLTSTSGKNKKAIELGIRIIDEQGFISLLEQ